MGRLEAIPKAEVKKFLEEGAKNVNNNVFAIVREDYIHKADYETRLKADLKAILVELQLEIEESENCGKAFHLGLQMASNIIQQKINELKAESEPQKTHI